MGRPVVENFVAGNGSPSRPPKLEVKVLSHAALREKCDSHAIGIDRLRRWRVGLDLELLFQ